MLGAFLCEWGCEWEWSVDESASGSVSAGKRVGAKKEGEGAAVEAEEGEVRGERRRTGQTRESAGRRERACLRVGRASGIIQVALSPLPCPLFTPKIYHPSACLYCTTFLGH